MANKFATNYPIPSSTNFFAPIWKLTRIMKAAGWTYKASSNGFQKDTTGTASNDLWGSNADPTLDNYVTTGISTTITAGFILTSATTSITVGSTASFQNSGTLFITIAGDGYGTPQGVIQVPYTSITSSTTFAISYSGSTAAIPTGANVGCNAMTLDQTAAWIVLSGPQTVKLPLNANPTGAFVRGEIVTQATTSATGELLGYTWDPVGGTGWAAILPQTNTFNMTTANTITGGTSGATMAPLSGGTLVNYSREIMIFKTTASTTTGTIYFICCDASGESAQLFSSLATQTGCTATVGPGMGGTSNGFPTKGIVIRGTSGSNAGGTWFGFGSAFQNYAQIACVNATSSSGVSADGSFYILAPNSNTANTIYGWGYFRVDDTESADVDPYVFLLPEQSTSMSSWSATTTQTATSSSGYLQPTVLRQSNVGMFVGYQSRGNPATGFDIIVPYTFYPNFDTINAQPYVLSTTPWPIITRISNSPAVQNQRPLVFEKLPMYGFLSGNVGHFKGRPRWILTCGFGNTLDTFSNKTWIGINAAGTNVPCYVIGPYDGVSNPQR